MVKYVYIILNKNPSDKFLLIAKHSPFCIVRSYFAMRHHPVSVYTKESFSLRICLKGYQLKKKITAVLENAVIFN